MFNRKNKKISSIIYTVGKRLFYVKMSGGEKPCTGRKPKKGSQRARESLLQEL